MDFVHIIKDEHARINELLDRLAETSAGALKTRNKLVNQLSTALEEHTGKEEVYLYPALLHHRDAHKDAGDFLDRAIEEHGQITRSMSELEAMPKDDEGFHRKTVELRKIAHHHMREEERILPAVRKAMSEEEAKALDEALASAKKELPQDVAEHAERGSRSVLAAAEIYSETAQLTAEDMQAIATCSTIAAGGMTEMRQAWMDWLSRTLRSSARASQDILRCTTLDQVADVQRAFLKESLDHLLEGSAQMLKISSRVSEDARRPIEEQVTRTRENQQRRAQAEN